MPVHVIDFMKKVPTTWDQTIFIDGYPGKYSVIARRHGDRWYIAGVNAEKTEKTISISLPMLSDKEVILYADSNDRKPLITKINLQKNKQIKLKMLPDGGAVIIGK